MSEELFDTCLKLYRDIKRVREKLESISNLEISEDVKILLYKIRNENYKIYTILKSLNNNNKSGDINESKKKDSGTTESEQN